MLQNLLQHCDMFVCPASLQYYNPEYCSIYVFCFLFFFFYKLISSINQSQQKKVSAKKKCRSFLYLFFCSSEIAPG